MPKKTLEITFFAFLFTYLFLFFIRPVEFEDVWWHMATGRWILENGHIPHSDIFSFDGTRVPWILTHWLGSTIFYLVDLAGGLTGLQVFRALVFTVSIGIFIQRAYRKLPFPFLVLLVLCLAHALYARCLLRPLIFNFIFVQAFLIILFAYQKKSDFKQLLFLPALGILWNSIHLGSLPYGLAIIGAFWGAAVLQRSAIQVRHLSLALVLFCLSFFINPYGIEGGVFVFRVFFDPGFRFHEGTDEMMSPLSVLNKLGAPVFFLVALTVIALLFNRKNNLTLLLLFAGAFYIFFRAVRGIEVLAMVCGYIIIEAACHFNLKEKWQALTSAKTSDRSFVVLFMIVMGIQIAGLLTEKVYDQDRWVKKISLLHDPADNPAAGVAYLKNKGYEGRVFNSDTFGGYLIWAGYPKLRPFIDGRVLDDQRLLRFLSVMTDPQRYWPEAEKDFQFRIAVLKPSDGRMINYLKTLPRWKMRFEDQGSFVFVKE